METAMICVHYEVWGLRVKDSHNLLPTCPHLHLHLKVAYLCDHWKSHDEETNATAQSKDRLVCAQVLGELIWDGGHYGLNGGKLKWGQEMDSWIKGSHPEGPTKPFACTIGGSSISIWLCIAVMEPPSFPWCPTQAGCEREKLCFQSPETALTAFY